MTFNYRYMYMYMLPPQNCVNKLAIYTHNHHVHVAQTAETNYCKRVIVNSNSYTENYRRYDNTHN